MTENRYYTGIDKMRFAAALLVIAIQHLRLLPLVKREISF